MSRARILADYVSSGVTAEEFDYMDGVTSNVQTQIDAASGINSPWQHIASWGTNVDLTGTYYINFQGVFTEEYTMYKILIPFLNTTSAGDELWMRFLTGDIDSTSKSITVGASTGSPHTGAQYIFMNMMDSFDGTSVARTTFTGYDVTKFIPWINFKSGNSASAGVRGEINIYNLHKTKLWNYVGTPAQLSVTRGGNYYGPTVDWRLFGSTNTSLENVLAIGEGYLNNLNPDDHWTGFQIYLDSNKNIARNSMVHILGLKLDLVTS